MYLNIPVDVLESQIIEITDYFPNRIIVSILGELAEILPISSFMKPSYILLKASYMGLQALSGGVWMLSLVYFPLSPSSRMK